MTFPLTISDQAEFRRMISDVLEFVADKLPVTEKKRSFMTKQECYDEEGRYLVDKAIKNGTLRVRMKEGSKVIIRKEFDKWKEQFR